MIVHHHDWVGKDRGYDCPCCIPSCELDSKADFLVVMPAVACDPRGQHTLASRNVHIFGAAKDHDSAPLPSLVFCWICWCWWVRVFCRKGGVDISGVDGAKDRDGPEGSGEFLGLLAPMGALSLSANAVVAAFENFGHVMVAHQPGV